MFTIILFLGLFVLSAIPSIKRGTTGFIIAASLHDSHWLTIIFPFSLSFFPS
jgi:hypothetical protein